MLLIKKFKLNLKKLFKGKKYALKVIIFGAVRKLANYIEGNAKTLNLRTPNLFNEFIDPELKDKILTIMREDKKAKK
ncbi:MAG: hypothetical protein QW046_05450 [Candidatus Micrarchaeaceae archaeon]